MKLKRIGSFAVILIVLALLFMYPLDSYISAPGSAYELAPLVELEGGEEAEQAGAFSLMTITMAKATPVSYVLANFSKERKRLPAASVRRNGEDEAEYNLRQQRLMTNSQFNAITMAFEKANQPYTVKHNGILIMRVLEDGAADKQLELGDVVTGVDGVRIQEDGQFAEMIAAKKVGDQVELTIDRKEELVTETITLGPLPGEEERVGLGIQFEEYKSVETDPEVVFHTSNIGGPSAGLMFTLELFNRLTEEDMTKGYDIAGTGEMLADGTVGRIGGADFKVIAAAKDGMDIFFAPDDEITEEMKTYNPSIQSNYEEAVTAAKAIKAEMEIVPVRTVDDAIHYLEQLTPKKK